jgi:mannose-1-phosphate guanylyltransferase/mannose-6-phosphate isomerase
MSSSSINVVPVVLCGGSGSRLWPLSRQSMPKQFLNLTSANSLFQETIIRINTFRQNINKPNYKTWTLKKTLISTSESHRFMVLDQLDKFPELNFSVLLEPLSKNTGPALTFSALSALDEYNDPILIVLPSDHGIADHDKFSNLIDDAIQLAIEDNIIILGVTPDKPDTGFGYIKVKSTEFESQIRSFDIESFTEKPHFDQALKYLADKSYKWNSGIFVLKASLWLRAIKEFRPDIFSATKLAFDSRVKDQFFIRPNKELFEKVPSESIDYAVIENCPNSKFNLRMLEFSLKWSDLGTWQSIWELNTHDINGNVIFGDVMLDNTHNSLIYSNSRLVTAIDLSDIIVVETSDAVMIAKKDSISGIKSIVSKLNMSDRSEANSNRKVFRPWGWFDSIESGNNFKVKRILVKPGASLSLQKHTKRAEHWVVIKGIAEVTQGENTIILNENESTFIPVGITHRLANKQVYDLEIIEIQTGSYLGEDDIIRFEDIYGRL